MFGHQSRPVSAVQTALLDARRLAPVCPEHEAAERETTDELPNAFAPGPCADRHSLALRVHGDRARMLQALADQRLAFTTVCRRHRDRPQLAVRPVDVPVDPVHRQTLGAGDPAVNHSAVVGGVSGRGAA